MKPPRRIAPPNLAAKALRSAIYRQCGVEPKPRKLQRDARRAVIRNQLENAS